MFSPAANIIFPILLYIQGTFPFPFFFYI
uniref:Uncharacterized protein n=1 Tax=Anguilla anguilla TaxID=7936 RepID=A0A0E9QZI4_ANGAN